MKVIIERTREEKHIEFSGIAEDLVKMLGLNPEEVLVSRNNELITLDTELDDSDEIKMLSVISGG